MITGKVIKGKGVGRSLGFPTANIPLKEDMENGIYFAFVEVDQEKYPSLAFVDSPDVCEVYILDYEGDLYEKEIKVSLLDKVRNSIEFDNDEELIEKINEDEEKAREFFKS